jgi:hypothetical protein
VVVNVELTAKLLFYSFLCLCNLASRKMGKQEKSSTPGVAEGTSPIGIPLDANIAIEERISAWTKDFPVCRILPLSLFFYLVFLNFLLPPLFLLTPLL